MFDLYKGKLQGEAHRWKRRNVVDSTSGCTSMDAKEEFGSIDMTAKFDRESGCQEKFHSFEKLTTLFSRNKK